MPGTNAPTESNSQKASASGEAHPFVYENRLFKFTYQLPVEWHPQDDMKSKMQGGNKRLQVLLVATEKPEFGLPALVMVDEDFNGPGNMAQVNTEAYLQAYAKTLSNFVSVDTGKPVILGGLEFSRQDFQRQGQTLYLMTVLAAQRYGHVLRIALHGGSKPELDRMLTDLRQLIRFDPDWGRDPGPDPYHPASGDRDTVPQGISQGRLINQIRPEYPERARTARIQGSVVMNALIGSDGRIAALWLISGHPWLVPPAMAAVTQWTYKPYLLNGSPVSVFSKITVNFALRGY